MPCWMPPSICPAAAIGWITLPISCTGTTCTTSIWPVSVSTLHLDEVRRERIRLGRVVGRGADELRRRNALARATASRTDIDGALGRRARRRAIDDPVGATLHEIRRRDRLSQHLGSRRAFEQLLLDLGRGHLRRAPAHVGGVARERADVPRHDVGVAVHHRDVVEAHAELLGDDLRERGVRAGAEARGAGQQHDRAVLVHLARSRCPAP